MTLIVYKAGELIADTLVVKKKNTHKGITHNQESVEPKIQISDNNCFAYAFNNDQFPEVIDPILIYLTRFEKGLLTDDEPELSFKEEFKLVIMSRRHFYTLANENNEVSLRVGDNDTYISPDGSFKHYEVLRLTAREIFESRLFHHQHYTNNESTSVKQSSLTLIRKRK